MNKIISVLCLILVLCLCGCSSLQIGSVGNDTSSEMSASYYLYSGIKEHTITVEEGKPVTVSADIVTKKGSIDVFIYKDKDNYSYKGKDIPTSDFTVALSDPGIYTLKVKAHKHKGSYSFKW